MERYALYADNLVLASGVEPGYVLVKDSTIEAISSEKPDCELRGSATWLAPGFIDTHIHGFAGHDLMDCDPEGLVAASQALAQEGTICWLPTTVTASAEKTAEACASAAAAHRLLDNSQEAAARIGGIFLEGPFFAPEKAGAQDIPSMCDPSLELLDSWQEQAQGLIKKSALAPERAGSAEYVKGAFARGVVTALGHTNATAAQALEAVEAGASVFVHTYNAMSALNHREPGVVGAAMTTPETFAEIICDGVHVNPVAVSALARAKGWAHTMLITDCLSCGGPQAPGSTPHVGDKPVEVRDGAAWMEDGHLGGSILTMARAVKNVCDWGIATPEEALRAASEVPARAHNMLDSFGVLEQGRAADLVMLDDELRLVASFVGGVQA